MFRHAYIDVCVMCTSCGSSQCCVLHDLQFVNAIEDARRPYMDDDMEETYSGAGIMTDL